MFISCTDKKYYNKYNHNTLKGRVCLKLNMINWATKKYDYFKPIKDLYWKLGWKLYDDGRLNLKLNEGEGMGINWIKYIRWTL